jgi:hypothetical protein
VLNALPDLGQGGSVRAVAKTISDDEVVWAGLVVDVDQSEKPAAWRRATPQDPDVLVLPDTLSGLKGGALACDYKSPSDTVYLGGWSTDAGDVRRAVHWKKAGAGPWVITTLPEDGFGGQVNSVAIDEGLWWLWAGHKKSAAGQTKPVVWSQPTLNDPVIAFDLPLLPGGQQGEVTSLTVDGQSKSAAGWADDGNGRFRPCLYRTRSATQPDAAAVVYRTDVSL